MARPPISGPDRPDAGTWGDAGAGVGTVESNKRIVTCRAPFWGQVLDSRYEKSDCDEQCKECIMDRASSNFLVDAFVT